MTSRRFLLGFCLLSLWLTFCSEPTQKNFSFTLLHLNDVYEIAPLDNGKAAGLARVATIRKNLLKENSNTITLLAGDFLSPSLIGNLVIDNQKVKGQQMVETLNKIGLDYVTFGNHEFDISEDDLIKRLNESEFKWTTANTLYKSDSLSMPFEVNGTPVPEYIIHKVDNEEGESISIGIIGITLPFNKAEYVTYLDFFKAFEDTYKKIKNDCDLIIALTHLDIGDDLELAKRFPELLIVLGGHDHTNMMYEIGDVVVAKADANAKTVYAHRVNFNAETRESKVSSELIQINEDVIEDPDTKMVVDKWMKLSNENLSNLGYSPDDLVFSTSDTLDVLETSVRNHQTNFTNLVVEALLYGSTKAKAAVINSGSIRLDDLLYGNIYEYDILKTFPYGGSMVLCNMPGSVLIKTLNIGKDDNIDTGGYLQLGNLKKTDDIWYIDNEMIRDDLTYPVILPKFVMEGNEQNLEFLKVLPYSTLESLGPNQVKNDIRDIFIDYMRKQ